MYIKILELFQNEHQYHNTAKISFVHEEETFTIKADYDPSGTLKEGELTNEVITGESGQEFLFKDFSLNIYNNIKDFFYSYLEKENSFLRYHYTGSIRDSAYNEYTISYDIEQYPKLIHSFEDKNGESIELRQSGQELQYVKKDSDGEIMRDDKGLALYLNTEEMKARGLNLYETSIVAFNSKKESVGLASDEFGADGIWVNTPYQKRGIGSILLEHFRAQFPDTRKMGQMTSQGISLARSYYRKKHL